MTESGWAEEAEAAALFSPEVALLTMLVRACAKQLFSGVPV